MCCVFWIEGVMKNSRFSVLGLFFYFCKKTTPKTWSGGAVGEYIGKKFLNKPRTADREQTANRFHRELKESMKSYVLSIIKLHNLYKSLGFSNWRRIVSASISYNLNPKFLVSLSNLFFFSISTL
jgi:hypothetical protein